MRVTFFSTKSYDENFFEGANGHARHALVFHEAKLNPDTAALADGSQAVCAFVNDDLGRATLEHLAKVGVAFVAMRCAGFNNVDLDAARELGLRVVRVPAYSPHAVAEHTAGLLLALNRRLYQAYNRVRDRNFSLEGLAGFDVHGLTVGIVGTGTIGKNVARVFTGFGCKLVCHDVKENESVLALGGRYVGLPELFRESDIITLHCPLFESTYHMIDADAVGMMKDGVTLLNTSRGGLIDTAAVIDGLKSGRIGNLGIDVYEEEDNLFFEDQSASVLQDDLFARLLTFPNVLITGHQAFFTKNALREIAATTLANLDALEAGETCENEVGSRADILGAGS